MMRNLTVCTGNYVCGLGKMLILEVLGPSASVVILEACVLCLPEAFEAQCLLSALVLPAWPLGLGCRLPAAKTELLGLISAAGPPRDSN